MKASDFFPPSVALDPLPRVEGSDVRYRWKGAPSSWPHSLANAHGSSLPLVEVAEEVVVVVVVVAAVVAILCEPLACCVCGVQRRNEYGNGERASRAAVGPTAGSGGTYLISGGSVVFFRVFCFFSDIMTHSALSASDRLFSRERERREGRGSRTYRTIGIQVAACLFLVDSPSTLIFFCILPRLAHHIFSEVLRVPVAVVYCTSRFRTLEYSGI